MIGPSWSGKLLYARDGVVEGHRLLVGIPCRVGDLEAPTTALLDTASEWCVLGAGLVDILPAAGPPDTVMLTRFGALAGTLERLDLTLIADDGQKLRVDATWFVSEEWPGPTVIGWRGALERIRFAVDPVEEHFYFGEA